MQITFDAMSVRKPLLSTSALKRRGVTIIFNHDYDRIIFGTRQWIECRTIVILTCESHWRMEFTAHHGWRKIPSWHEEHARICISRDCDSKTRTMANCRRHRRYAVTAQQEDGGHCARWDNGARQNFGRAAARSLARWTHTQTRLRGPSERDAHI